MHVARFRLATSVWVCSTAMVAGQVLTTQYDNARSGATLTETALTPATVNVNRFGKVFRYRVDGDVYAQPLYVPHLEIAGKGTHDVVFVATEHDSVYAFDATGSPTEPLWHVNFLDSATGITTLSDRDAECPFISPEIGITPTPAIDQKTGTLYVLSRSKVGTGAFSKTSFAQHLHALAITTGVEKFGGPVQIQAPGFDPLRELPRPGLLLDRGQVYLTWASSCDVEPYHGWVMAYDAATLKQTAALNVSPNGREAGIWQSDNGPAADGAGHVYVATGNGTFDASKGGPNYGDSLLRVTLSGGALHVDDFFTPPNQADLSDQDLDFGSGGPVLLADRAGAPLILAGGKDGKLRVLDPNHLGRGAADARQVLSFKGGIYSAAAFWNGRVYLLASNSPLQAFTVSDGRLSEQPVDAGAESFPNPGATPAISANGIRDGIVWVVQTKVWNDRSNRPAILHAFDAMHLSRELFSSETNAGRDRAGAATRFAVPTVANGRVYVGAKGEVDVYGQVAGSR